LKVSIASLKPCPSGASRFSFGTFTSSGALAELVFLLADAQPLAVAIDDERRDALVTQLGIAGGEHHVPAGVVGVGDPRLLTVEHIVVADLFEGGLHARHVRARRRLGGAVAGHHRLGGEHAQVFVLLLVAAAELHRRERQAVRQNAGLDAGAAVRQLLADERVLELAEASPTVVGRAGRIDDAQRPRLFEHVHRKAPLAVALGSDGRDALGGEAPRRLDQLLVFFGQGEIEHLCYSFMRFRRRSISARTAREPAM
jgi:hypothetical protein